MKPIRLLNLLLIFALLLGSVPIVRTAGPSPVHSSYNQDAAAAAATSADPVHVDVRDHGPDPQTTIALVGQSVVWTNNGTQSHTITEGDPIFRLYLPVVLRDTTGSVAQFSTALVRVAAFDPDYIPLFDSGFLAPGESFTYTFAMTGTFMFYSTYKPGSVVGALIVVQPGETVSETIEVDAGATVTTITGASLQIGAGDLLTDTIASITELPTDVLTNTEGTPVGTVYDVNIAQFENVVSDSITLTLPYNPALVPPGTDASELEVAYFNGLSWIGLGGTIDDVNHNATITTSHLSLFGVFKHCEPAFTVSDAEREAYEKAKDFMHDVLKSQDVYAAFKTTDGKPLFELPYNGRNARWLGTKSLCEVANSTPAEIESGLDINATAQQVVGTMVALGERLSYAGDDHAVAGEVVEYLSEAAETSHICLEVLKWSHGALINVPHLAAASVIIEALKNSALLYFDFRYSGKMSEKETEIAGWLLDAEEVGQSNLGYYTQREDLLADECIPTEDYNGGFYEIIVCGSSQASPPCTLGYVNLFRQDNDLRFVVGIHGTWPFYENRFLRFLLPDPTDRFFVFLEYQDTQGSTRASLLRFENYKTRPALNPPLRPCTTVAGWVPLPDAIVGTEVKIKHIFVEDGHLDTRVAVDGVQSLIPVGKKLYYLPVTMDQVYTTDFFGDPKSTFRPGEAIILALVATNHTDTSLAVTYDWDTYDPADAKVSYLSWNDQAELLAPGEDDWYLWRGIAADAPLGTYNYTATVSSTFGTSAGNTTFDVQGTPIPINFLTAVTCKGLQNNKPVDVTNTFTTDDDYVYAWAAWEGASGAHAIRWEWYRPDDTLFGTFPYEFNTTDSLYYLWSWVYVPAISDDLGQWSIKIYMDDTYVQTLYFTLVAGTQSHISNESQPLSPNLTGVSGGEALMPQPVFAPIREDDD